MTLSSALVLYYEKWFNDALDSAQYLLQLNQPQNAKCYIDRAKIYLERLKELRK